MKITYRQIQHALSECRFHPNDPGLLKVIIDVDNPQYFELRALELVKEAQENSRKFSTDKDYLETYNDSIIKAIRLLILAKEYRNAK